MDTPFDAAAREPLLTRVRASGPDNQRGDAALPVRRAAQAASVLGPGQTRRRPAVGKTPRAPETWTQLPIHSPRRLRASSASPRPKHPRSPKHPRGPAAARAPQPFRRRRGHPEQRTMSEAATADPALRSSAVNTTRRHLRRTAACPGLPAPSCSSPSLRSTCSGRPRFLTSKQSSSQDYERTAAFPSVSGASLRGTGFIGQRRSFGDPHRNEWDGRRSRHRSCPLLRAPRDSSFQSRPERQG